MFPILGTDANVNPEVDDLTFPILGLIYTLSQISGVLVAMVTRVDADPGKAVTSGASLLGTDREEVSQHREGPSWGDLTPD